MIDQNSIITLANPTTLEIFGYEESDLIGKDVSMLLPESHHKRDHAQYVRNSRITGKRVFDQTRDLHGIRKDGSTFPLELTVSPVEFDKTVFFVGIMRDITLRTQQEQALVHAKEEAEHAKDRAEQANRAKSEFLSRMSHELRTPLNAILGFSQLLSMDDSLAEDQIDSINMISMSGQHLLNLVNDILDVAQVESGQMSMSLEPVDVHHLVEDMRPLIETELQKLNIKMTVEAYFDGPVWVMADHMKIKQVLLNLLSNAAKYNRENGFIAVTITQKDAETVGISIQDNGIGMDERQQAALFEPFNRLGKENSEIEGTGIGLVICRELVRMMDGALLVQSQVGQGSNFTICLPAAELNERQHQESLAEVSQPEIKEQSNSGITTILYVEDNPANMTLVRQLLSRFPQYHLMEAVNAEDGVVMAREQKPDIVLMDINLPGMSGFDALDILIEEGLTDHMTVIALSANALVSEVKRGLDAGFDHYLTKPIDFSKLIETIKSVETAK
jgi:PAS domain S-box-containing protein